MASELETSLTSLVYWVGLTVITYPIWKAVYNLTFHPLRSFPGPWTAACSPIPHLSWIFRGFLHTKLCSLHDQYGDVVRISPDVLVYKSPQAFKDICGHRKNGAPSFEKDPKFYPTGPSGPSIVTATEADHSRMRRLLSHAFSEKAMRDQEALLQSYIDLLIQRLHDHAAANTPVDVTKWYNYTTFDIVGDLSFGEPFDCLQKSTEHSWVTFVFHGVKASAFMRPFLLLLRPSWISLFVPARLKKMSEQNHYVTKDKLHRRFALQATRPDFITYLQKHNDERGMTIPEIEANAVILIIAGSETTATLLSGCTFLLLQNPDAYARLAAEIRTAFQAYEDITFISVAKLPYLNAVLEESLRMYPPFPGFLPRVVPDCGAVVDGRFVPGGTTVSMAYLSAFRASSNFAEPDTFLPERWLDHDSPRFAGDKREVMQPFSYGPRNCLGKSLAYAEMRLIVAKLLWEFDIVAKGDISGWMDQRSFTIWEKNPLMVELRALRR